MKTILLWIGLSCLGYCVYTAGTEQLNQSYDNWVFEQNIAGRHNTDVASFLRERTPFGFLVKDSAPPPSAPVTPSSIVAPAANGILGKLEINRLNLSAMVREGVDTHTLSESVGHVPSTALPGNSGNFALAAHRDTLFRALKDIKTNDLITFQTPDRTFQYRVHDTRIVQPTDVSVLGSNGHETLTLITCYPFYYVGAAPKRFIVRAQFVSETKAAAPREIASAH